MQRHCPSFLLSERRVKRIRKIINSLPFFFCYFGSNTFQQVPHSTCIQYKKKPQDFSGTKLTSQSLFLLIRNHVLNGGRELSGRKLRFQLLFGLYFYKKQYCFFFIEYWKIKFHISNPVEAPRSKYNIKCVCLTPYPLYINNTAYIWVWSDQNQ